MIKKLRKKLVLASMVSLLVVLLIIEGSIGILNYQKIVADADQVPVSYTHLTLPTT